jgi:hypothetical protein
VSGSFDLIDEIMRMLGQDPYSLEKARFLSATLEFRIKLAIEARKADMKNALDHLPSRLDELWGDGRYTARERRRILYEIWYEVDRTPDGERAARIIDDFIHRRLPCGSPDTYTAAELEAFSRLTPRPAVCAGRRMRRKARTTAVASAGAICGKTRTGSSSSSCRPGCALPSQVLSRSARATPGD